MLSGNAETFYFDIVNVMGQPNTSDCGLFAIANTIALSFGDDPAKSIWEVSMMCPHLLRCLTIIAEWIPSLTSAEDCR